MSDRRDKLAPNATTRNKTTNNNLCCVFADHRRLGSEANTLSIMEIIHQPAGRILLGDRQPGRTFGSELRRKRPGPRLSTCLLLLLTLASCSEARLLGKKQTSTAVLNMTEHASKAIETSPQVNQTLVDATAASTSPSVSMQKEITSLNEVEKRKPIVEEEEEIEEPTVKDHIHVLTNPTAAFDDEFTGDEDDDFFKEKIVVKEQPNAIPSNLVIILVVGWIVSMVFTAWQMSDNPDGIFAALCRLILSAIQLTLQILTSPCRKCCGYNESYGRISTMDYGYKDPALELS